MGLHDGAPPFDLVQLSTLPESQWKGKPVFHPCGQKGDEPQWLADEFTGPPVGDPCYDVGVVLRWEPDPDFADLGGIRVHFLGSFGSVLHYDATNLWVPQDAI